MAGDGTEKIECAPTVDLNQQCGLTRLDPLEKAKHERYLRAAAWPGSVPLDGASCYWPIITSIDTRSSGGAGATWRTPQPPARARTRDAELGDLSFSTSHLGTSEQGSSYFEAPSFCLGMVRFSGEDTHTRHETANHSDGHRKSQSLSQDTIVIASILNQLPRRRLLGLFQLSSGSTVTVHRKCKFPLQKNYNSYTS